jgi:hypothetical protein
MFKIIVRVVLGLVLFALVAGLLAGAGAWIYNSGVTQGLAASGKLTLPANGQPNGINPMFGYSPFFFHPMGFLGPFGLIPLFIITLILFGVLSRLFFWGRFGARQGFHGHFGRWSDDTDRIPPMVEEWHRRMHGQTTDKTQPPV